MNRISFISIFISSGLFAKDLIKNSSDKINQPRGNNQDQIYDDSSSVIDVKSFGAKGDGLTDDSVAIQNAINQSVVDKKPLYLSRPKKSYLCKRTLKIVAQIYIYGDGMNMCGLNFLNCNGIEISEGITNVIFERFSINQAIRYSNNQNQFVAIKILGSTKSRPFSHVYRDLFIDGFNTAFDVNWIWDSLFDNVKILFGKVGFNIKGTSVNNNICNTSISVAGTNSKGVFFSDTQMPTEGWRITNLLTFGAEIGIHSYFTSNVYVVTPILDFCAKYGVLLESGKGPSTNWQILGGYIAMKGDRSISGISINNSVNNNQVRGCKISNVDILAYAGTSCQFGIELKGTIDQNTQMNFNTITNFKKQYFNR